jgi:NADH:ubiquinone oxidoreductase subunit 4 (subunit M)
MHQTENATSAKWRLSKQKALLSAVLWNHRSTPATQAAPPLACFISEFFIFVGAIQIIQAGDSFYIFPTAIMLVATVFSLAYSLRFISKVSLAQAKTKSAS